MISYNDVNIIKWNYVNIIKKINFIQLDLINKKSTLFYLTKRLKNYRDYNYILILNFLFFFELINLTFDLRTF